MVSALPPPNMPGMKQAFKNTCAIKKMWCVYIYIYIIEYYSAITRDEIESFVVMWINLESVIQSEVSQKEENK